MAAFTSDREEEYETQLYGFSSNDLSAAILDIVQHRIKESSKAMADGILLAVANKTDRAILAATEEAVNTLTEKCNEHAKEVYEKKLKEQLRTYFSLPSHVLLPEDTRQRDRYTEGDEENLKGKIAQLKTRLRRAKFLKSLYNEELVNASKTANLKKLFGEIKSDYKMLLDQNEKSVRSVKEMHKFTQSLFALEVKEVSLKLTDRPSCEESSEVLEDLIYVTHKNQENH